VIFIGINASLYSRRIRASKEPAMKTTTLLVPLFAACSLSQSCPDYSVYSQQRHPPFSTGRYQLSSMRPAPECRTFNSSDVEDLIAGMEPVIADPDLYRLFENSYPNTLDTAIRWRGVAANNSAEELTFVITGDINAMWLRDSANQMQSYLPVLKPDESRGDSIASLYRGVINLQARYLLTSPFCNSFQAPAESGIPPATNGAAAGDTVKPSYDPNRVFECKYELDSLAAFLEVSANYYTGTGDVDFFGRFQWVSAVQAVQSVARAMQTPTYGPDGAVLESPYLFTRQTTRATETFANDGLANPVANGTGLVRSGFRPSDDATILQLFIPANMMFARYLEPAAEIMAKLGDRAPAGLAEEMSSFARELRRAIETYGVVPLAPTPSGGTAGETVYAYEVDGFGGAVIMDDANIPSLLAAPFFGYVDKSDATYQRTRKRILDADTVNGNPYFMRGPVISSVGGPHVGPGAAWPMADIVRIFTSDEDAEIASALQAIVSSTDGYGLIHESVNSFDAGRWTRQW
jgi:meiotically up-regulated gene 157 (Mug157) protein